MAFEGDGPSRSAIITLIDGVTFNNTTTASNSNAQDCYSYRYFLLYLNIDSTNAPTDIQFLIQYSDDGGTTWYDYRQGLFASLFYEDTVVAAGILECFSGEVMGRTIRLRVVATGTTSTATFLVTAKIEFRS